MEKKNAMNQLEFFLEYTCNHSCLFCSAQHIMTRAVRLSFPKAIQVLRHYREIGYDFVNFTGGEPLLYDNFHLLLQAAKKMGYRTYISTNADKLGLLERQHGFLDFCDQICISLHGACEQTQSLITGNPRSFRTVANALEHIESSNHKIDLIINTVICRSNCGEIPGILDYVSKYSKVFQILISNLVPEGRAIEDYHNKTLRLTEAEELARHISKHYSERFVIRFFGYPLCCLGDGFVLSNDLAYDPRLTVELVSRNGIACLEENVIREPVYLRSKPSKCAPCLFRGLCGGVFNTYLDLMGDAEIKPIIAQPSK